MKYQMPESVAISAADGKLYTAAQVQAAFDMGVEAAAQAVIKTGDTNSGYLVQAIRNLAKEPSCA